MINIYEAISSNKRRTWVIALVFFLFFCLVIYVFSRAFAAYLGYEVGGFGFVGIAMIFSGLLSLSSYFASDKIVLFISQARPADRKRDFNFYTVTENLCIGAGIPKPKLYVIEDTAMNAFATGRNPQHAVVCATRGLLDGLNRTELEGVIAHELSHIKSYDILLATVVSVMVGSVALLGDWFLRFGFRGRRDDRKESQIGSIFLILGLVFAILSPIIAQLIQLALSRRREYSADAGSISITRQPDGLISALKKISLDREPLEAVNKATAHLYIENPFKNERLNAIGWFAGLFNTHPPVEERIKLLQKMT